MFPDFVVLIVNWYFVTVKLLIVLITNYAHSRLPHFRVKFTDNESSLW